MTARRLLRAVTRPIKRLVRPLRLWSDRASLAASQAEARRLLDHLYGMSPCERNAARADFEELMRTEYFYQAQLRVRIQRLESAS